MYSFMNLQQYNMPQMFGVYGNNAYMPNPYFCAPSPISCFNAFPQVFFNQPFMPEFNYIQPSLFGYNQPFITGYAQQPFQNYNNRESLFNVSLNYDNIFKFTPKKSITDYAANNVDYSQRFLERTARRSNASSDLKSLGYNSQKGRTLSNIAIKNSTDFTGYCAKYVKEAIEEAGLGKYESGHAYQCADILRRNPNFKEISANGLDLKKLPAGCILVYGRGVSGYSSEFGHIEITDGKGNAVSDGTTTNIRSGARVFIPV